MKIRLLLSTSLFLILFSVKSFAQVNNCDVRQLKVETYDFALKNLDSLKAYTKNPLVTVSLEFSEKGDIKNIDYYTAYADKNQKKVKVWKNLETFVKESFSHCPDSHFYNGREQVLTAVFALPLMKEELTKAKKEVESGADYIPFGEGQKDIDKNSKYTLEVKNFTVGKKTNEPLTKEGVLDYNRSKMVKLSDIFHIAFELEKVGKITYLKYKLYERVDNKGVIITSENWRPVVNGKVNLSVKGIRDTHPGVKHVKEGEEFDFDIQIAFHS